MTGSPAKEVAPAPTAERRASRQVCWEPKVDLDIGEWAEVGRRLGSVGRNIQWVIGDWIAYGNERFGERYSRAAKITGYDPHTLMNMVYVATHFPASRRRENLSWSHHEALAALDHDEQERWLDQADRDRWSVADLRTMLRVARKKSRELDSGEEPAVSPSLVRVLSCPRCGEEISVD